MSTTITITVPGVPVNEPTTSYNTPINVTAGVGQNYANAPLGAIQNDGNVDRTLEITISNVVGGSVQSIGLKDQNGNMQYTTTANTFSMVVPAGASTECLVTFDVVPGAPGDPATQVTADLTDQWV